MFWTVQTVVVSCTCFWLWQLLKAINYGRVTATSPSPVEKEAPKDVYEKIEPVPPDSFQASVKTSTSTEKQGTLQFIHLTLQTYVYAISVVAV